LSKYTLVNTDATKTALHQRLGKPKKTKPAKAAQVKPHHTGTLSQAQACAGLQVKAVDKAGTKATMTNHTHQNTQRLRTSRISAYPNNKGDSAPKPIHTDSHPGVKGNRFKTAVLGTASAHGVAAIQTDTPSKLLSATCPKPNGTEGGYISAKGHKANNTKAPCVVGSNQSSRNWFQRRIKPMRSSATATPAPNAAPNVFKAQSRFDGTRRGK
jgi:hypothetical protein